jgi:hypothetical protein
MDDDSSFRSFSWKADEIDEVEGLGDCILKTSGESLGDITEALAPTGPFISMLISDESESSNSIADARAL